jgi:hypothetical protein
MLCTMKTEMHEGKVRHLVKIVDNDEKDKDTGIMLPI